MARDSVLIAGDEVVGDIPRRRRRRWDLVGLLASVALVIVAYHPIVFGGMTFDTSLDIPGPNGHLLPSGAPFPPFYETIRVDRGASAWQTVPWARVVHRELARGRVPLWNPYEGTGEPLAGNMQSAAFDPLMTAVNLHPTTLTWDLTFLFCYLLAAAGMYLFLRNLGISILGAVAGSGAFTFCGFFAMDNNLAFARLYLYLPLLFLLIDLVSRSNRLRWTAALGVAIGATVLGGMPEVAFLVVGSAIAYGLFRSLTQHPGARLWAGVRMGAGGALGLAIASPLLILLFGFVAATYNVHGPGRGVEAVPPATLLNWLIPYVNWYPTIPRLPTFVADRSWAGGAAAALTIVAAAAPRAMRRSAGWFFAAMGAVLLLKVHGVAGAALIAKLSIANRTNFVAFAPPVVSFCVAVLAAIGIEAILRSEVSARWLAVATSGAVAAGGLLVFANRRVVTRLPPVVAGREHAWFALALAAGAAIVLVAFSARLRPSLPRVGAGAAATVMIVEMALWFAPVTYVARADPYDPAPAWLPLITATLRSDPTARVFGLDGKLFPNTSGAFGLQDVRSLSALLVSRYRTFINRFVTASYTDRFTGEGVIPSEIAGNPMFALLGVRYVVAGPTTLDQNPEQFRLLGRAAGSEVYENLDRTPRAFVASDVHAESTTAGAISYLEGRGHTTAGGTTRVDGFDPRTQAVVESPVPTLPASPVGGDRQVTISSYEPDEVVVDVGAGPPGLLVLTDAFAPGWVATVNGRPAPVLPTDVAFRGVVIGDGGSRIVFRYLPPGVRLLWAPPVLGLLALSAVAGGRRLRAPMPV